MADGDAAGLVFLGGGLCPRPEVQSVKGAAEGREFILESDPDAVADLDPRRS